MWVYVDVLHIGTRSMENMAKRLWFVLAKFRKTCYDLLIFHLMKSSNPGHNPKQVAKIRVVILGNQYVGKSSIVRRYLQDNFHEQIKVFLHWLRAQPILTCSRPRSPTSGKSTGFKSLILLVRRSITQLSKNTCMKLTPVFLYMIVKVIVGLCRYQLSHEFEQMDQSCPAQPQ